MFKTIHPRLFAFDIEWIPDPDAAKALWGIDVSTVQGMEAAYQKLWEYSGATEEKPQPFVKLTLSRIVSICGIYRELDSSGSPHLKLVSIPSNIQNTESCGEAEILKPFLKSLADRRPQLVGFNSLRSDLPIVVNRSIAHGLTSHGWAMKPDKPWEGSDYFSAFSDYHLDLATFLGTGIQIPRLHEIAMISGIPGKIDISGESVAEMWLAGNLQEIVNYNEYDAFTTYLLWARIAHFTGHLSPEQYDDEQLLVEQLLDQEIEKGKKHLDKYKTTWLAMRN